MNHHDKTPDEDAQHGEEQGSLIERQMRRLVVPEPATYDPSMRLDVVHDPDLNVLWGGQE